MGPVVALLDPKLIDLKLDLIQQKRKAAIGPLKELLIHKLLTFFVRNF